MTNFNVQPLAAAMKRFDFIPQPLDLFAAFFSDGYKLGHGPMYSEGTELVVNNLTPRSDKIYRRTCTRYYDGKLIYIGGQGAVMEMVANWNKFFAMDKTVAIEKFKELCDFYLGAGVVPSDSLEKLHDLGYLPLEIKTLDEGDKVPMGVPVMTIKNTVPHAFWLVNFLETTISQLTWKTSTTGTIAGEYKSMLTDYAVRTGSPLEMVTWQGHSFADRGMSGPEDAARTGFGHSSLFMGSDSLGTVLYAQQYYFAGKFVSGSVPATEHAVATSNILRIERALNNSNYKFATREQMNINNAMRKDDRDIRLIAEVMFLYELMLKFPKGILSYVTDSFDFWAMLTIGLPYLKEVIMERDGKLVIRPDSGDPVEVVRGVVVHNVPHTFAECDDSEDEASDSINDIGYSYTQEVDGGTEVEFFVRTTDGVIGKVTGECYYERYHNSKHLDGFSIEEVELTAEQKGAVQVLWELFGGETTSTGHMLLDSHIGLIYGDSITTQRCLAILEGLDYKRFASGNVVFGIGSFTYNCLSRDVFGFAVKATYTEVDGEGIEIFKDPKTDSKKKSAKGLLFVTRDEKGELVLIDQVSAEKEASGDNLLVTRFKDGVFYNLTTLDIIRSKL